MQLSWDFEAVREQICRYERKEGAMGMITSNAGLIKRSSTAGSTGETRRAQS